MHYLRCIHSIAPSVYFFFVILFFLCFFVFLFLSQRQTNSGKLLTSTSLAQKADRRFCQASVPPVDVSTQHQTSESKVKHGKPPVSGPFSRVAQNAQIFPMLGGLWSCVDMAQNPLGARENRVKQTKKINFVCVVFVKKNLFRFGKTYLRCSALKMNKISPSS